MRRSRLAGALAVLAATLPASALAARADHYRAYAVTASPAVVEQLKALGFDLHEAGARRASGRFELVMTRAEAAKVRALGIEATVKRGSVRARGVKRVTVARARPGQRAVRATRSILDFTVYRSYSEPGGIADEIRALAREHRAIAKLVTIGRSVDGQPILAVKVTKDARRRADGSRPVVLYVTTQHAREWLATETGRRLLRHVLEQYGTDPTVTSLVDTRELWFVPVANPDGYDFTFTDGNRLWRKTLRDNDGDGTIAPGDGVDPNRNYPTRWNYDDEGSNTDPASETYRGTAPASEPETRALDRLMRRLRPRFLVNYHTAAELLLYPYGFQVDYRSPDDQIFEALAGTDGPDPGATTDDDAAVPGYDPDLGAELYITNGETTDHAYDRYGTLAFTPELDTAQSGGLGPEFSVFEYPDDEAKIQAVFEKNLPFALNVAASAKTPVDPVSARAPADGEYRVKPTADFVVDAFPTSFGDPQPVQVTAKRRLGKVALHYRINGGDEQTASVREWRGGERFGTGPGIYYRTLRGNVRGTKPGDSVEVWFASSRGAGATSDRFTYTAEYEGPARAIVVAAEDYTGVLPDPSAGPKFLAAHQAVLTANGIESVGWDVDARGRTAPHPLGVLAHFDLALWYTGDDVVPRDATQGRGTAAKVQHDLEQHMRAYLNEGGKLIAAGPNFSLGNLATLEYPPGPTAPVPLSDDFLQYWLGAYQTIPGGFDTRFAGLAVNPFAPFTGDPVTPDPATGAPSQFLTTSSFLDPATYPQFTSRPGFKYVQTGPPSEAPIEGQKQAYAAHADGAWERLTRTIDVPAGTTTLDLKAVWDVEQDFDAAFLEVHTVGNDDWTTLPDTTGKLTSQPLESCLIAWQTLHPFVTHYQTFDAAAGTCAPSGSSGSWNALTGRSGGWTDVSFDLSAYAGKAIEISLTYASDFASGGTGFQVDDVRLTNDGTVTALAGFEDGLGGFAVPGPPDGTAPTGVDWVTVGVLDFPGEEAAAVVTPDTVLFGFGLEQLDDAARTRIAGEAATHLLG